MRSLRAPFVLGCALVPLLGACAGAPLIYNELVTSSYNPTEYGYGAGRRDLATEIRGDPFEIGQERFEAAVLAALARHPPRPQPTNFTTDPGPSARPQYRALFLFDAPRGVPRLSLCRRPVPVPQVETGDAVRVTAAFCREQGVLSAATGEVDGLEGVDDPAFDALISQVVFALFPPFDPNDDDDRPILVPH